MAKGGSGFMTAWCALVFGSVQGPDAISGGRRHDIHLVDALDFTASKQDGEKYHGRDFSAAARMHYRCRPTGDDGDKQILIGTKKKDLFPEAELSENWGPSGMCLAPRKEDAKNGYQKSGKER